MEVSTDHVARWLSDTARPDEAAVRSATANLETATSLPGFAMCLLTLSAGGQDQGQRTAAATYLKNYIRYHWSEGRPANLNERLEFRNQLVHVLLEVDSPVLKLLAEAFRLVIVHDFVRENTWPELVPALRTAIQSSNLVNGTTGLQWKTLNAFVALQTITKPFQYFMNPTMAREPVPEQLELITKEILVPSYGIFHPFVEQVVVKGMVGLENECVLLTLCKCFHLAVKSHMPSSLIPSLAPWYQDFLALLDTIILAKPMAQAEQLLRLKTGKRCLQIFCTLVTRHRKHSDKFMSSMITTVLKIVKQGSSNDKLQSLPDRIISLAFDVISRVLETGPGWRLIASHFTSLLENAIFPALRMNEKDMVEWDEDADEYLRRNLPSDLDEASGWREDLYTPRRSAINLLSVIALSKGPPMAGTANKIASAKRKKGGKSGKGREGQGSAGELLVIPFLSKYLLPSDGSSATSDSVANYYGVLLAYGSLQEFFKVQSPEHVALLLRTRVLPLYSMSSPSPYLVANANWLLGELAICLPEELNQEIYNALLKALVAPNVGNVSWRPVRASAAGALAALLQEEYKPADWLTFLQIAVSGATSKEKEEAGLSLRLLATAAEIGEEKFAFHVPAITSAIKGEITKHIPPIPKPWPQVVELGFSALAAMARTWESAEPDESENGGKSLQEWKSGYATVARTFSDLLQQAWLSHMQEGVFSEILPPPSCLNDASVLLCSVMKYAMEPESVTGLKIEPLLQVWADLIAEWSAWEEEEDLSVFEAIQDAITLHERCNLKSFVMADVPPPPAPPVAPRSIVEGIATFISSAIELAYSAATWRACLLAHSLLHIPKFSFESESIKKTFVIRFTQASYCRLQQLRSRTVPLGKPLILVIAACYLCFPSSVEKVLLEEKDGIDPGKGFIKWAEALAYLAEGSSEPGLTLESELKLAVMALVKVLEHLLALASNHAMLEVARTCFQSLLDATIRLKEVREAEDSEEDEGDADNDEEEDGDETDEEEDSDDDECEETEEEFLERYAQTARDLQKDVIEEAEGGEEEDGQEIELGILGMTDQNAAVLSLIQKHHRNLINGQPLPQELVDKFLESFPECHQLFSLV
eukprot:Gb_12572 [translate_table: standard]